MSLTAIVLCGGKGERMPFGTGPKCLLDLKGLSILERQLKWLSQYVDQAVVCIGNEGEKVASAVQHINYWTGKGVLLSNDGEESHIAKRIDRAVDEFAIERALVVYGDTLAHVPVELLENIHRIAARPATMTVTQVRSEFGIVHLGENGRIEGFDEKPLLPYWKNIGHIVLEREALSMLEGDEGVKGFPDYLAELAGLGKLSYYQHSGTFLTVNTRKDYILAQEETWYE